MSFRTGFIVCTLLLVATAGCASSAYITPRAVLTQPPPIAMQVGLHITPAAREFVANLFEMDFEAGANLRNSAERHFHKSFDRVVLLYDFPPRPGEVEDVEVIFVLDKPYVTAKRMGIFDHEVTVEIPIRIYDPEARQLSQASQKASILITMGALNPVDNINVTIKGIQVVVDTAVVKFLHQYSVNSRVGVAAASKETISPLAKFLRKPSDPGATGLYRLEEDLTFNVLDRAEFDPETGLLTLAGHLDTRYATGRIPYLQHLAEILDHPRPEFSLAWTPESERRVDALFSRLDEASYQDELLEQWTAWIGQDGKATAVGKVLLPLFGVQATKNGGPGGIAGFQIRYGDYSFVVTGVNAGSAAARAGVRVGDEITLVNERQFYHVYPFTRFIDALGAGSEARLSVSRGGQSLNLVATLDAASGDPWGRMTRFELVGAIFHAAGNHKAGQMVETVGVLDVIQKEGGGQEPFQRALQEVFLTGGTYEQYADLDRRGASGAISLQAYRQGLMRLIAVSFDAAFDPYGDMVTTRFDQRVGRGMSPSDALAKAFADVDELLPKRLAEAFPTLYHKRPEIQIPPEIVYETIGIRPKVKPEFIGFDGGSQLARVLYHADYLGKSLVNMPGLPDRIPRYETEFSYYRTHPRRTGIAIDSTTERLWISVESFDLAQSADGQILETRGAKLRFNIRDMRTGRNDEVRPGDYEALLTSLYEDFAQEYPVLHELRETAKLTAVANWIKAKDPTFGLPKKGRTRWAGPIEMPGLVYFTWATEQRQGVANFQMMANGGVSLVPPVGPSGPVFPGQFVEGIPKNSDVVVLRDFGGKPLTVFPAVYRNEALRRVVRGGRKGDLPVPRPPGWVTEATLGKKTLQSLSVLGRSAADFTDQDLELKRCMDAAQDAAFHLAQTERLINNITQKNPQRQAELKGIRMELVGARKQFIEKSVDILLSGMVDASGFLDTEEYKVFSAAKGDFDGYKTTLERIKLAADTVQAKDSAQYDELISQLTDVAKELTEELAKGAKGPTGRVLKPLVKSINYLEKARNIYETGSSLYTLARSMGRLAELGDQIEKENALLRDKLLPLQRKQSDLLNARLKCPALASALQ